MGIDLKRAAAEEAVTLVRDGSLIGLGAGSTMAHMVDLLALRVREGMRLRFLTSSFTTERLLEEKGLSVIPTASAGGGLRPDLYFDGCDQVDKELHALKSGGGIHTQEKLLASMAAVFVIVGDEAKYAERFDGRFPVVLEVIPEALHFVPQELQRIFPGASGASAGTGIRTMLRMQEKGDGAVLTRNGNYLFDSWFDKWPPLAEVNPAFKSIPGVLETSLFYNIASKAILAGTGGIRTLEKSRAEIR